jgi:hypothetical protein
MLFLILSVPCQVHSEEDSGSCASSVVDEGIKVSPASASCPYAKKKFTIDMSGKASDSWKKIDLKKEEDRPIIKSDKQINSELRARNTRASSAERGSENARIEAAKKLHKQMEWESRIKNAEDWCKKHCNFVLKARDKIEELVGHTRRATGKQSIMINEEEYIDEDGKFVKLKEAKSGK